MGWCFSEDIELTKFADWVFPETHDLFVLPIPSRKSNEKLTARLNQILHKMKYNICWFDTDHAR